MKFQKIMNWKKFRIDSNATILEATKKLNNLEIKTLLVCNEKNILLGTITDGDLRRSIINGFHFQSKVLLILNKNPIIINSPSEIFLNRRNILNHSIQVLPLVNHSKIVKSIFFVKNFVEDTNVVTINNPVLIMAGGKGKRLGYLTKKTPKPLLKFNNSSALEKIIDNFLEQKFVNISVSIHHMAKKVKKKLSIYEKNFPINCIEEIKPLGTIGSLAFIDKQINSLFLPIVVINSDIITNIDFIKILNFHKLQKADVTIVGVEHEVKNPYGVLDINNKNILKNIHEKQSVRSTINAGVYIFEANLVKFIKKNSFLNMDSLLKKFIRTKKKLIVYKLKNYWYEIGSKEEYRNFKSIIKSY
jgi:dTDP-glucose pyrophosphorylase